MLSSVHCNFMSRIDALTSVEFCSGTSGFRRFRGVSCAFGKSVVLLRQECVSIDQKTVGSNPRSTVGTMTDLWDYLRMLYATLGTPYCPRCQEPVATRSPRQMLERVLQLPPGTEVELRAPVFEIFGENWEYSFEQVRLQGYRRVRVDGVERDLGGDF